MRENLKLRNIKWYLFNLLGVVSYVLTHKLLNCESLTCQQKFPLGELLQGMVATGFPTLQPSGLTRPNRVSSCKTKVHFFNFPVNGTLPAFMFGQKEIHTMDSQLLNSCICEKCYPKVNPCEFLTDFYLKFK
jgi:hypothetical protein